MVHYVTHRRRLQLETAKDPADIDILVMAVRTRAICCASKIKEGFD
jgi:hypothetical protein